MVELAREREHRAGVRLGLVVAPRLVADVLADALLAAAVQVDHRGQAPELGGQLEREHLERVALDPSAAGPRSGRRMLTRGRPSRGRR